MQKKKKKICLGRDLNFYRKNIYIYIYILAKFQERFL